MFASDVQNASATCYVKNLHPNVTEEILSELFSQVGPVLHVILPPQDIPTTTTRLIATLTLSHTSKDNSTTTTTAAAAASPQTDIHMSSLRGLFEPFGTVMAFHCTSDQTALIVFDHSDSCEKAAKNLNNMTLGTLCLTAVPHPVLKNRYAFVTFDGSDSVLYAMRVLTGTILFGTQITVERRNQIQAAEAAVAVAAAAAAAEGNVNASATARNNRGTHDADDNNGDEDNTTDHEKPCTSSCVLTGLPASLMHVDVRDMAEWAARSPVVDMALETSRSFNGAFRSCRLTFGTPNGATQAAQVLSGYSIRNCTLSCVETVVA